MSGKINIEKAYIVSSDKDRVEIYRPLIAVPREGRRKRAVIKKDGSEI